LVQQRACIQRRTVGVVAFMACAITSKDELEATVKFDNFRQKWEDRKAHPEALKSESLPVGGWELRLELSETIEGKAKFFICRHTDNRMLLPIQRGSLECVHKRSSGDDGQNPAVIFVPDGYDGQWLPCPSGSGWGWSEFATVEELFASADRSNGVLSVKVYLSVLHPVACRDLSSCLKMSPADLLQAFSNTEIVTITGAGGCEVKVFDRFLRARSSVLAVALQSEMEESRTHVIKMPDVQKQVLEDFRDCLNSGGLPSSVLVGWQRVAELLVLVDKYAISSLADACEFYLSMTLSPNNISKLLAFSDKYGLARLRKAGMYFTMSTKQNFEAVVASDEYDTFSGDLLREIAAFEETRKDQDVSKLIVPTMLQWGDAPLEFPDSTDWQTLPKKSLRRACFERLLGTAGTAAELLVRLSDSGGDAGRSEVAEPDAKRQRTGD